MSAPRDDVLVERPSGGVQAARVLGVLPGEGVGPEVIEATLAVLAALEDAGTQAFEVREAGPIGLEAEARDGTPLSENVAAFCDDVFAAGGAVLAGPGGGRFVYDLRERFDLFYKLSPLRVLDELVDASRLRAEHVRGVDVLVVRENASGFYHGGWEISANGSGERRAAHRLEVSEREVRRVLDVAAEQAAGRRGSLAVVVKSAGIPAVSGLWQECALDSAGEAGVECSFLEVDHAAFQLIQRPHDLDVVAAPDLYGDVLADLGGVLLGSRGLTYSGNFSSNGAAVYQTNHGCAYDIAGTDTANPAGQIQSLAMLLRDSFGLDREAALIEEGLRATWAAGWRTADLAHPGGRVAGTRELGELTAEAVAASVRG